MNTEKPELRHLRYRPGEIGVTTEAPFANDKLNREPFVRATTDLLLTIREPFVIALNAPWGSGKTTTLNLLEPNLKQAGVTTVSFNAWEVDDATDPLVPLVAKLHDRLLELKGYGPTIGRAKIDLLKRLGSSIVKHSAIAAVKVATVGVLNIEAAMGDFAKTASAAAAKAREDLTGDLIDNFKRERQAADQFRTLLEELISYVRVSTPDGQEWPPLVLIIDELDRCRPTFAVAMLERIKHFFSVPGLVFLLALDLEQLKASTRKVYGAELDATEYLRRFIDLELRLPPAKLGHMVDSMLTSCGADAFFEARSNYPELKDDRKWISQILEVLSQHFELSPRMVQRMISRLMLVVRQTRNSGYLDPIIVIFLIFLRIQNERLLRQLVGGRVSPSDLMEQLRAAPGGQTFYSSHVGMLIEAYLLYAHRDHQQYVTEFQDRVKALDENDTGVESSRLRELAHRYSMVCQTHFRRGWLDLRAIDERINLVAMDLADRP